MLLGDVIAKFEDEAFVNETLIALDELAFSARVFSHAADIKVSVGEFAAESVGRFVNSAIDEEWLTLLGLMARTDNPGQVFLRQALSSALPHAKECGCV